MVFVEYIEFGLLYATAAVFLFRYRQLSLPLRRLFFYILNLIVCNTSAFYTYACLGKENLFLYHFFTPTEYLALCLVFYTSFESRSTKRAVLISMPSFVILSAALSLYVNRLNENNSAARAMEALLVTVWILLYFREVSRTDEILNLKRDPLFWVYAGLILYFWGTLFLQILLNYLNKTDLVLANQVYALQYVFEYISLITINIALFCHKNFKRTEAGKPTG